MYAQTIFKEWFGKYQIGDELPEGWRAGALGEVVKLFDSQRIPLSKAKVLVVIVSNTAP
jgi:type I restriction enzyme S subunit